MNGNRIIEWSDVITTIKNYKEFLATNNVDLKDLQVEKENKLKELDMSEEDLRRNLNASKDLYEKAQGQTIKKMLIEYFAVQMQGNQILVKDSFDFIKERMDLITDKFGFEFSKEEIFSMALDVANMTFAALSTYSTINFDEKEKALIEERQRVAKENLKINRAFGRDTEVMDSVEEQ